MARRTVSSLVGRKGEVSEGWRIEEEVVGCTGGFGIGMSVDACFRWVAMALFLCEITGLEFVVVVVVSECKVFWKSTPSR